MFRKFENEMFGIFDKNIILLPKFVKVKRSGTIKHWMTLMNPRQ